MFFFIPFTIVAEVCLFTLEIVLSTSASNASLYTILEVGTVIGD